MASVEPYTHNTTSPSSLLDRILGPKDSATGARPAVENLVGRIRPAADTAVEKVRANPRPYIIGAAVVGVIAVGAALLANRRTREMGMDLADKARSRFTRH